MLRYARGVDRKDFALVASCFTEDAQVAYGSVYTGDRAGLLAFLGEVLPAFRATMHFLGNHAAEIRGDVASAETYALAHHVLAAPGKERDLMVVAVRYLDELVRDGDVWRIRRRVVPFEWQRLDQGVVAPR
jgi:ketosteroid isomerase-like protein